MVRGESLRVQASRELLDVVDIVDDVGETLNRITNSLSDFDKNS